YKEMQASRDNDRVCIMHYEDKLHQFEIEIHTLANEKEQLQKKIEEIRKNPFQWEVLVDNTGDEKVVENERTVALNNDDPTKPWKNKFVKMVAKYQDLYRRLDELENEKKLLQNRLEQQPLIQKRNNAIMSVDNENKKLKEELEEKTRLWAEKEEMFDKHTKECSNLQKKYDKAILERDDLRRTLAENLRVKMEFGVSSSPSSDADDIYKEYWKLSNIESLIRKHQELAGAYRDLERNFDNYRQDMKEKMNEFKEKQEAVSTQFCLFLSFKSRKCFYLYQQQELQVQELVSQLQQIQAMEQSATIAQEHTGADEETNEQDGNWESTDDVRNRRQPRQRARQDTENQGEMESTDEHMRYVDNSEAAQQESEHEQGHEREYEIGTAANDPFDTEYTDDGLGKCLKELHQEYTEYRTTHMQQVQDLETEKVRLLTKQEHLEEQVNEVREQLQKITYENSHLKTTIEELKEQNSSLMEVLNRQKDTLLEKTKKIDDLEK
ncbi:chromosome segregation protein, partial [Reticulomyxa filosa]